VSLKRSLGTLLSSCAKSPPRRGARWRGASAHRRLALSKQRAAPELNWLCLEREAGGPFGLFDDHADASGRWGGNQLQADAA
jgi:hypothetical protein